MAYKFPVNKCENCGEALKVDKDTAIQEEEGFPAQACCPKCFVFYELEGIRPTPKPPEPTEPPEPAEPPEE